MAIRKIGLWMVGACGGVGSSVALGLAALSRGKSSTVGLVTELPEFRLAELSPISSIVVGGHEIRNESFAEALDGLHRRAGLFDEKLVRECRRALDHMQINVRPGSLYGASQPMRNLADRLNIQKDKCPADAVERLAADIQSFRRRRKVDDVVVVYLASTEPPIRRSPAHSNCSRLSKEVARRGSNVLPTSSLYALAAIEAGCAFVNFTPSTGVSLPAIRRRAMDKGIPFMGRDGKTGETLVKSVLAPMFAARHLNVLSWFGQNILGNRDGEILKDPKTRAAKLKTKDMTVQRILDGRATTKVSIDFMPSLDDWKIAWDYIHFEGFLGTRMSMQFIWQGSDSILAAPLVIDLVRLSARELRRGAAGPMKHLAFFFKEPMDVDALDLSSQWRMLRESVDVKKAARGPSPRTPKSI